MPTINITPRPKKHYRGHDCLRTFNVKTHTIFRLKNSVTPSTSKLLPVKVFPQCNYLKGWVLPKNHRGFYCKGLRAACANLNGLFTRIVEVDESYIGYKEENKCECKKLKSGRGSVGKQTVLG